MAVQHGAFGCATTINPLPAAGARYSDNDIINRAISNLPNYYFVKGFYGGDRTKIIDNYNSEKDKNKKFLDKFMFVLGHAPTSEERIRRDKLHKFIFSMYAIDALPSEKYSINHVSCTDGRPLPAIQYPTPADPARHLGICMRRLGIPFVQWDTNRPFEAREGKTALTERYSITTFLNFLKKLEFLNTICLHDDLHAGNFTFDTSTNEFNIIDFGSAEFNADHHRLGDWFGISIDEMRPGDRGDPASGNADNEAKKFNTHLNKQRFISVRALNSGNKYYWRTIENLAVDPRAAQNPLTPPVRVPAGQTYFDSYINTHYFYYALWGDNGELRSIFDNDKPAFHTIVNNVHDSWRVGFYTLYRTNFWICPKIIKLFSVLFSHPNPLCRPLVFNVRILLDKLLKIPQNTITFTKTVNGAPQTLFEIESLTGDKHAYSLDNLNYSTNLNHRSNDSIWITNPYLKYYKTLNYYFMCNFIGKHFDTIVNNDTFSLDPTTTLYCKPFYTWFNSKQGQAGPAEWEKDWSNGYKVYEGIEFKALKVLQENLNIVEPHIHETDVKLIDNVFDIVKDSNTITFTKPPGAQYRNCP